MTSTSFRTSYSEGMKVVPNEIYTIEVNPLRNCLVGSSRSWRPPFLEDLLESGKYD